MGIVDSLARRRAGSITAAASDVVVMPAGLPVASPWASRALAELVFDDVVGKGVARPVTRAAGMKIPALARGANSMKAVISGKPLRELDGDTVVPGGSPWLFSTDFANPQLRMAWTIDDLIWYGTSLWSRINGGPDNRPTHAERINRHEWRFDDRGRILVRDELVREDSVILFTGLHEGILSFGDDAIRDATELYAIVRRRLRNPAPTLNLNQTEGRDLTEDEIDALIARWAKARTGENGGVGFTSRGIEPVEMGGQGDAQLLIEARNAAAVDMARILGTSASRVDATSPKSSLNYETKEGTNLEFVDFDLDTYTLPITSRLSMDDIVAPGRRVAFDLGNFMAQVKNPTGTPTED